MMENLETLVAEARDAVAQRLGEFQPKVALVLGSGLSAGRFQMRTKTEIPMERIPHLPKPSVVGI